MLLAPSLQVIPTCVELGIGLVAFSPLGGGFLTGEAGAAYPHGSLGAGQRDSNRWPVSPCLDPHTPLLPRMAAAATALCVRPSAGAIRSAADLSPTDLRSRNPRFSAEAIEKNARLLSALEAVAQRKGCTAGQLALAWVAAKGRQLGLRG